tara:strand:- start:3777 stop:4397 length:621 start_codon:yes stop_codon:yes gene_type:complete
MKKSELKSFIKENIVDTLNESPSSEEIRMARQAVARFMKYRNVSQEEAVRDLINALKEIQPKEDDQRYIDYLRRSGRDKEADALVGKNANLKEVDPKDVKLQQDLNAELEKTVQLKKDAGIEEDIDDDDVDADAIKAAKGARGKHKKLDLALKALKSITSEMKSLARKYSAADETEKEKIKDILRKKTPQKKELESLVAKLEKDVV